MTDHTPTNPPSTPDEAPIETRHRLELGEQVLEYITHTGLMPLKNAQHETEANLFFMSYTLDSQSNQARPLTFVFNGGPGSGSLWLHLGALGPKRVKMQDEGWMPAPPYQLIANPYTWLAFTDLVFIDPVGTGFSRATKPDLNKNYWSVDGDIASIGEFIRLYLSRYGRWTSPLYVAGESYGTTRAAGLSSHLIDHGIALSGIMMISTILNVQTVAFDRGNDLAYALFLPTYTATAWYHHRLAADLQARPLREVLNEVEAWAMSDYTIALMKGDRLEGAAREAILSQLTRYTGLTPQYLDGTNLRIQIHPFCKELLRDQKRTVGRLDSRFTGFDANAVKEEPEFDPSLTAILPPYTALINHYTRAELGYQTDHEYHALSFEVNGAWSWDRDRAARYTDTSEALRVAWAKNPFMRVFVGMGYYDLATPHFAAEYTFTHMDLDPSLRSKLSYAYYEAGHMMYLEVGSLAKLYADVRAFIAG